MRSPLSSAHFKARRRDGGHDSKTKRKPQKKIFPIGECFRGALRETGEGEICSSYLGPSSPQGMTIKISGSGTFFRFC